MREIEFRVWDNQEKVYLNKKDIAIDNLGNIFIFEGCDDNDAELWHARILSDPDNEQYAIEQFTGLTDRNGVGLYEGDIVKFTHKIGDGWGNNKGDITELKYMIDGVSFSGFGFRNSVPLTANKANKLEVIGNIHESSELLERKRI